MALVTRPDNYAPNDMGGQQFLLLAAQNDRLLHLGGVATNRLARGLPGLPLTTDPYVLT
jgi:hypothetical protein